MQIFHTCLLSKRAVFGQAVKKQKIAAGSAGKSYFKDKSSDVREDSWSNQLQQTDSRHLTANLICLKVRCSSNSEQPISSLGQQAALFLLPSASRLYYSTAQMVTSGWVPLRARHQRRIWTGQMMDSLPKYSSKKKPQKTNPKNKINNCSSQRYRAKKRNSGEAVSWTYMLIIFCAERHPSKMCPLHFTNNKWSKKVTVPNPALAAAFFFFFATESSKKHGCRCENRDSLIFHHLVEQLMQEVFTGSTCSNSPTCCNAGTPCRIWPTTLLQVKSPLCCVLVKEVIMLQHKYLPIVLPTAVHKQFSLQRMSRLLELGILFIIAQRAVMKVLQDFHVRILCFPSYF